MLVGVAFFLFVFVYHLADNPTCSVIVSSYYFHCIWTTPPTNKQTNKRQFRNKSWKMMLQHKNAMKAVQSNKTYLCVTHCYYVVCTQIIIICGECDASCTIFFFLLLCRLDNIVSFGTKMHGVKCDFLHENDNDFVTILIVIRWFFHLWWHSNLKAIYFCLHFNWWSFRLKLFIFDLH